MRIGINCHTLYHPMTGVQKSLAGLVNALAKDYGDKHTICAYIPWKFSKDILHCDIEYIKSWAKSGNRTMRIIWEQFRLHAKVFDDKIDVLHCPSYVMPLWCLKPTVVTVHDVIALKFPTLCKKTNRAHFKRLIPESVKRSKLVVVPSNAVKRDLLDCVTGVPSDKVRVVPWGISENYRNPISDEKKQEVILKYGLPPKFVLHVGRMEPKKNVMQLIEAFFAATAVKKLPHRLVLAGPNGWGIKNLDKIITELGLKEKVYQIGFVAEEDMPALYSLASVLCFPSITEGFGLPLLEAMNCGTPVVSSNIKSIKEVTAEIGLFSEVGNLPSLRENLETILTDEELSNSLSEKGKQHAKNFTWRRHTESMMKIYEEAMTVSS